MNNLYKLLLGFALGFPMLSNGQVVSYPFIGKSFSSSQFVGSSRLQGLGGNFNVIGADVNSIAGNAAGLGFYNRSEINLSGSFGMTGISSNYIGTDNSMSESQLGLTGFGIVLAGEDWRNADWKGNLGISYARQLMFKQSFTLSGVNNASSLLDKFIQSANKNGETGASLDDQYDYNSNTALSPEAVAYQSYLINPNAKTGGAPFTRFEPTLPTKQFGFASAEGFLSNWNFSYGLSYRQKFYIGAGLHFSKIQSTLRNTWDESFIGARFVDGFSYGEKLETNGNGYSISLGMIYKVNSNLRAAFNFHSPTYFRLVNEQLTGGMNTRAIAIPSFDSSGNPVDITKVGPVSLATNEFSYQLTTPMRIGGGLAYFFGKKGFLTMDLEMVDYASIAVSSDELGFNDNQQFKAKYNGNSQKYFQTDINIKIGAEFRLDKNFSIRGGVAQFGSGYQKNYDPIDRTMQQFSGGFGYKSDDFYIDAALIHRVHKDAYTPYVLDNAANYASSTLSIKNTSISVTAGIFF